VVFTNWGEDKCPPSAILLQVGSAVQTVYPGGPLLCLQSDVQLHNFSVPAVHTNPLQTLFYTDMLGIPLPVQCAICYVPTRTVKFTTLGTTSCPENWTAEYVGTLATQHYEMYSDGVCVNLSLASEIDWDAGGHGHNDLDLVGHECLGECPDGQVQCAICTR
jgi:hypothetical protein